MSSIISGSSGYIYAMSCGAIPDLIKLGATTKSPTERAKQLTASTSSPSPFVVLYSKRVSDCTAAEALLHERFADRRVNDGREFFQITLEEAALSMDRIAQIYRCLPSSSPAKMPLPWSELFASFDQNGPDELTAEEQAKCRALANKLYGSRL